MVWFIRDRANDMAAEKADQNSQAKHAAKQKKAAAKKAETKKSK